MKAIALLLSVALLAGAAPQDFDDYARREVASRELEDFQGGFTGVWIVALFSLVLGGIVWLAFDECEECGRATYEVLPPWEGPPRPPTLSP